MTTTLGTVIFSHGKESGPWGTKIRALAGVAERLGYGVESVDYRDLPDPDRRVVRLREHAASRGERRLVLVGSSMGGYVATLASLPLRPVGLFLMAPAFFMPGYACQEPLQGAARAVIVHGWHDTVIPPQNSIRFAAQREIELHLLRGDHQLLEVLPLVEGLFDLFLRTLPP